MSTPPPETWGEHNATRRGLLLAAMAMPWCIRPAWAALPRDLRLVMAPDIETNIAPPYSAVELTVRLSETVMQRAGIRLVREAYPWPRGQERVRRGESDAFVTIPTPPRMAYARFCQKPVLRDEPCVWFSRHSARADRLSRITSLAELAEFRAVMYRGSGWTQSVLSGLQPMVATTTDAMLQLVAAGRGDFFLDGRVVTLPRLYALGLLDQFEARPLRVDLPYAFHIGISRIRPDADAVAAALDNAITQLDEIGTLEDLRQAFVSRFEQPRRR